MQFFVWNWNAKARAEHPQLVFVELLLLVGDVLAFAGFAQPVTLNGFCQDDSRRALVFDRRSVGSMYFDRIVTAKSHARHLFVRKMIDHSQQTRISSEQVLAEISSAFHEKFLVLTVGDLT